MPKANKTGPSFDLQRHAIAKRVITLATIPLIEARHWADIVDPILYRYPGLDAARTLMVQERNPFAFADKSHAIDGSIPKPAASPAVDSAQPPSTNNGVLNVAPTMTTTMPSPEPSTASPSSQTPTRLQKFYQETGGCHPQQVLYEIGLFDQWGDGWDKTYLNLTQLSLQLSGDLPQAVNLTEEEVINSTPTISTLEASSDATNYSSSTNTTTVTNTATTFSQLVETGAKNSNNTLSQTVWLKQDKNINQPRQVYMGTMGGGMERFDYVCLKPDYCYHVDIGGGNWDSEITWQVRVVALGQPADDWELLVSDGGAPLSCQFFVVNNRANRSSSSNQDDAPVMCPNTCTGTKFRTLTPTSNPTKLPFQRPSDTPSKSPVHPTPRPTKSAVTPSPVVPAAPVSVPTRGPTSAPTGALTPAPAPTPAAAAAPIPAPLPPPPSPPPVSSSSITQIPTVHTLSTPVPSQSTGSFGFGGGTRDWGTGGGGGGLLGGNGLSRGTWFDVDANASPAADSWAAVSPSAWAESTPSATFFYWSPSGDTPAVVMAGEWNPSAWEWWSPTSPVAG